MAKQRYCDVYYLANGQRITRRLEVEEIGREGEALLVFFGGDEGFARIEQVTLVADYVRDDPRRNQWKLEKRDNENERFQTSRCPFCQRSMRNETYAMRKGRGRGRKPWFSHVVCWQLFFQTKDDPIRLHRRVESKKEFESTAVVSWEEEGAND